MYIFIAAVFLFIFFLILFKASPLKVKRCCLPEKNKRNILIKGENYSLEFTVSFNTCSLAHTLLNKLPVSAKVNKGTGSIYFSSDIIVNKPKKMISDINIGDVVYWPENKAICIFYTDSSQAFSDCSTPIREVIKIGHISSKIELLKKIHVGDEITIE